MCRWEPQASHLWRGPHSTCGLSKETSWSRGSQEGSSMPDKLLLAVLFAVCN